MSDATAQAVDRWRGPIRMRQPDERRPGPGRHADVHLSLTDRPCRPLDGAPYIVVERFGVPLAEIHNRR